MKREKKYKIAIWGSGGISKETAFLVEDMNESAGDMKFEILGFIEKDDQKKNENISGYKILGAYEVLNDMECDGYAIPVGSPEIKRHILAHEIAKIKKELKAFNLIHPSVVMRKGYVDLGKGNILCAGTILTTDIRIGNYNLINLNCTIGHDVVIDDNNTINPAVAISGGVKIGNNNLIGTGVKILQNVTIGNHVTLGAGAVVVKDITESGTYVGIPAKRLLNETC